MKNFAQQHPYLTLFALALLVRLVVALFFHQPGYSDAYYYTDVARNLWQGYGFRDNFIWNYLSRPLPPSPLRVPSSTYWLPLTSVLIYFSFIVIRGTSFFAAQLPMLLISAALAPLCYYISVDIFGPTPGKRYGWLSGLLMVFSGIYLPYFALPDNFTPFAILTAGFLVCNYKALRLPDTKSNRNQALRLMAFAGVLAGLSYLTRVDGVILLAVAVSSLLIYRFLLRTRTALNWVALLLMVLTFAITLSPWLLHNIQASGQLFPGGGLKTLFMREYNDFYSYSKPLDLPYFLNSTEPSPDWGIGPLILSRLSALWQNLLIVGRGTLLFMLPLFLIGLFTRLAPSAEDFPAGPLPNYQLSWAKSGVFWRKPEFLPFVIYTIVLYLAMSLIFTFPSTRGSVFHSSGGLLPFIYLLTAIGLDSLILQMGKISRPKAARSRLRVYSTMLVAASAFVALIFSAGIASNWDTDYKVLQQVNNWLDAHNDARAILMVPDAPAYYYVTQKPAIVITSDSLDVNLQLAHRYGATFLLFQPDHAPDSLNPLYLHHTYPGLTLVAHFGKVELYQIAPAS